MTTKVDKTAKQPELDPLYIDSVSMKPVSTPLKGRDNNVPTVYYTIDVWLTIQHIVKESTGEIGWLGMVEQGDGYYIIREIFIPKQTVTGATTDIEPEALVEITMQLLDEGKDPSMLRYWGHSHVHMAVRPSGRDERQIQDYLKHANWFIRGIYNKPNDSKVDVYDVPGDVVHQCVENTVLPRQLKKATIKEIDATLKANIQQHIPKPVVYTSYMGGRQPRTAQELNNMVNMQLVASDNTLSDELSGQEHYEICAFMGLDYSPDHVFTDDEVRAYHLANPFYNGD